MFYVCKACGAYAPDRLIREPDEMICPACAATAPIRRAPLFLLTGASGAGKSFAGTALFERKTRYIVMEADILWQPPFTAPEDGYAALRDIWLRMSANISQNGDPVLLAGCADPADYRRRPAARFFSAIEAIALVCAPEELARRLRARPGWRNSGGDSFIESALAFNAALRTRPDIHQIDTTNRPVEEVANEIDAYITKMIDG